MNREEAYKLEATQYDLIQAIYDDFISELETILSECKHTKDIDIAKLKIITLKIKKG